MSRTGLAAACATALTLGLVPPATAAVVAERRADGLRHLAQGAEDALDRLLRHLRVVAHRGVEGGHVGRVVPAVVELHRLRVDVRLVRVGAVGQRGQDERPGRGLLRGRGAWPGGGR